VGDLKARLAAFLPQFEAANKELEARKAVEGAAALDIEAVGEGEAHIAMVCSLLRNVSLLLAGSSPSPLTIVPAPSRSWLAGCVVD
jgi:hypothetical protein